MWAYEYQEGEAGIHEPENGHLGHAFIHLKNKRMSHCQGIEGIDNECLPRRYSWNLSRRFPTVDIMRRKVKFEMLIQHERSGASGPSTSEVANKSSFPFLILILPPDFHPVADSFIETEDRPC